MEGSDGLLSLSPGPRHVTKRGSVGLLIAVLAALGVGIWLAVSSAGERGALRAAAPHAPAAGGARSDDAMTPVVRGEPRSGAPRGEVAPLPVAPPTVDPGLEVEPPAADGIEILVRAGKPKEPVAGAIVHVADWSTLSEEDQGMLWWSDQGLYDGVERFGRRYRADESGVVRIPRPSEGGFATCEHDGLFGQLDLDSDPSARRTLDLEPDVPIRARVVDAGGAPVAGVPVGLRVTAQWWSWDILKATTGADGIATLEHAQVALLQQDTSQRFAVGIVMHAEEPIQAEVDLEALPSEPIELRLPAYGSVEVILDRIEGSGENAGEGAGASASPSALVFLQEIGREEEQPGYQTWSPRQLEDGRTLFATVGLGLRFIAQPQSPEVAIQPQEFVGPRAAGERVVVHLTPGAAKPRVTGRALLEDGTPLADARLRGTIQYLDPENDWTAGFASATDAEGRFSAHVAEAEGQPAAAGALELELEDPVRGKLAGSVPLAGRLLPGKNDVGDVRLAPPPLLVSGRVVDAAGNGIRGARVTVESASEQREVFIGYAGAGGSSVLHWGGVSAVSAADGSFEVRGEMAGDLFRVTATHADYRGLEPVEATRGASVVLTLAAAGRIAGRIEAEAGISAGSFQVLALDASGNPVGQEERREGDGRFELGALEPGSYAVAVHLSDENAEIARVDDVLVEAGKTTEDPRLDPIDVAGKVERIVLRVRDRDGNPPDELAISRRLPGESSYLEPAWWGGADEIVLVTAERSLDLRLEAGGARTVELFGASGSVDVTLGAGIPIELDLSSLQERLGASYGLYAEVVHLPDGQGRMDSGGQGDERGIVACSVGEPGEWGVRAYVLRTDGMEPEASMSAQIGSSLLTTIEVQDSRTPQTFAVTVEADELEAALSALGG
jgi:hypothetical protein